MFECFIGFVRANIHFYIYGGRLLNESNPCIRKVYDTQARRAGTKEFETNATSSAPSYHHRTHSETGFKARNLWQRTEGKRSELRNTRTPSTFHANTHHLTRVLMGQIEVTSKTTRLTKKVEWVVEAENCVCMTSNVNISNSISRFGICTVVVH